MVNTIKFSEFSQANLGVQTNLVAGASSSSGSGTNIISSFFNAWTTANRPAPPFESCYGWNLTTHGFEVFDGSNWMTLSSGSGTGTVTQVNTGLGLTGGPITSSGTISFASMPANTFWGNILGGPALPTQVSTSYFLKSANNLSDLTNVPQARINLGLEIGVDVEAWSPALDSIASLVTVANNLIYTTGSNTYAVITPAANSALITGAGSVPILSQTLPNAVQTNITALGVQAQALDMGSHQIHNVVDPSNPQDAATRAYVDAQTGNFLPITGGTMQGIIDMGNHKITNVTDPTLSQDAVTLSYLNTQLGNYLPLSGGTMSGAINMNSHKVTSVTDPTNPQDAATKAYVDSVATGFTVKQACSVATTANLNALYVNGASGIGATLTNNGALTALVIDGVSVSTNDRVLVKNQTSTLENGIYVVTNVGSGAVAWILTRATDFDQPAEIQPGDLVIINNGTVNAGTSWIQTDTVSAVGTDPIEFSQFTFSANAVLLKANNLSDVANTVSSFNNISPLTTKGDLLGYDGADNVRVAVGMTDGQILRVKSAASTGWAWSTATYPDTTTANQILYSSATNVIGGISTLAGGVLVTDASSVPQMLTNPGAAGKVLQSGNAAIPSWSTPTYPSASGSAGKIIRSDGTNNLYSTATYPDTVTVNTILFGSSSNVVGAIAATARGVLVSDNSSVPAMLASATITGQILQGSTTGAPTWSTPTYPSASGSVGKIIRSDGTNNVYSTATFPGTGGTAGNILISDGTNYIASTSLWPNTVGTAGKIVRSDGTTNTYSTSTFADTYTASNLLYSNGSNTVQGLATANNGVLVTSNTGVPSWNTSLGQGLSVASSVLSVGGANNIPFNDTHGIQDNNGNKLLTFSVVASAVNYFNISNNATGGVAAIGTTGSDSAVPFNIQIKNSNLHLNDSTSTLAPAIRFYNAAGSQFTGLKAATTQSSSATFVLPAADGSANYFMATDGSGNLSLQGAFTDYSGSISATGYSGSATISYAEYRQIGKVVFYKVSISGTSNSTGFTLSLPVAAKAAAEQGVITSTNNGAGITGAYGLQNSTMTLYTSAAGAGWTASGTKGTVFSIWYEAA